MAVFVGRHNEWYLEGLRRVKFDLDNAFIFQSSQEAATFLSSRIMKNDLLLVKGSQSARMERVVVALLRDVADRVKVCRQDKEWSAR